MSAFEETVTLSRVSYDQIVSERREARRDLDRWRRKVDDAVRSVIGENPHDYAANREAWTAWEQRERAIRATARVVVDVPKVAEP